jgi:hypothetical protein
MNLEWRQMGEYLGRIKKTIVILIAVLFVTSLVGASASAASGRGNGQDSKTIYETLSSEHRQVADLLQKAMHDNSKETFFKVKAKTDPHLLGEEKLFYPMLQQKEEL